MSNTSHTRFYKNPKFNTIQKMEKKELESIDENLFFKSTWCWQELSYIAVLDSPSATSFQLLLISAKIFIFSHHSNPNNFP